MFIHKVQRFVQTLPPSIARPHQSLDPIIARTARRSGSASVGQAIITRAKSGSVSTDSGKLDGKTRSPLDVTSDCFSSLWLPVTALLKRRLGIPRTQGSNPCLSASTVEKAPVFSTVFSFPKLDLLRNRWKFRLTDHFRCQSAAAIQPLRK